MVVLPSPPDLFLVDPGLKVWDRTLTESSSLFP